MPYQKNGKRDYKAELAWEHRHPERTKQREARHRARYDAEKRGLVHKGDAKQVDHIKPLSQGGSTNLSNTRVISTHANESYHRTASGAIATGRSPQHQRKGK